MGGSATKLPRYVRIAYAVTRRSLRAIRGANDMARNGDGNAWSSEDPRRRLVRIIAANSPVPIQVGPSAGTTCLFCRKRILTGALEYGITVGGAMIVADGDCYGSFLQEIVETPPPPRC